MNSPPLLVLGLGNVLLTDDGVGSAAVAMLLERYRPPASARVLDGGTLGLALLPHLEDAGAVMLVDAVRADAPAGTIVRIAGDDVGPAVASRLSPHQVGVADLLDGARWRGRYPQQVVLLGIVPAAFDLAIGLSPTVEAALPGLVERVVDEARRLGFDFERTHADETTPVASRSTVDVARLAWVR
jgi:hydrogenase maturation protease